MSNFIKEFRQIPNNENNLIAYQIGKIALNDNSGQFVKFQLESYRKLIQKDLPKYFSELNMRNDSYEIKFSNPRLLNSYTITTNEGGKTINNVKVTPMIARRYKLDYKGEISVDFEVFDSKRNKIIDRTMNSTDGSIPFCWFPIMVGFFPEDMIDEDPLDPKGYYVFNGLEYFLEIREKLRENIIYNSYDKKTGIYETRMTSRIEKTDVSTKLEKIGKTAGISIKPAKLEEKGNPEREMQVYIQAFLNRGPENVINMIKISRYISIFRELQNTKLCLENMEINYLLEISIFIMNNDISEEILAKLLNNTINTSELKIMFVNIYSDVESPEKQNFEDDGLEWFNSNLNFRKNISTNNSLSKIVTIMNKYITIDKDTVKFFNDSLDLFTESKDVIWDLFPTLNSFINPTNINVLSSTLSVGEYVSNFITWLNYKFGVWERRSQDQYKKLKIKTGQNEQTYAVSSNEVTYYDIVENIFECLEIYYLPHIVNDYNSKDIELIELVINCSKVNIIIDGKNLKNPIDRDNYGKKMFETSGMHLGYYFVNTLRIRTKKFLNEIMNSGITVSDNNLKSMMSGDHGNSKIYDKIVNAFITSDWNPNRLGGKQTTLIGRNNMQSKQGIAQQLDIRNIVSSYAELTKIGSSTNKKGRQIKVRMPHASQIGFISITDTPESEGAGLIKYLCILSQITTESDTLMLKTILTELIQSHGNVGSSISGKIPKYSIKFNGSIFKRIRNIDNLYKELIKKRREGKINYSVSIILIEEIDLVGEITKYISVNNSSGRIIRPVLVVENNKLLINNWLDDQGINLSIEAKLRKLREKDFTWFVNNGYVKYIDPEEQEWKIGAVWGQQLKGNLLIPDITYDYCEMHPGLRVSISQSKIPFESHMPDPRAVFFSSMGKQATQMYGGKSNYKIRFDQKLLSLKYGHKPIVKTVTYDSLGLNNMPDGLNLIVGVVSWNGKGQEDALIFSKSAVDRGMFTIEKRIVLKTDVRFVVSIDDQTKDSEKVMSQDEYVNPKTSITYTKGVIDVGQKIKFNDILVLYPWTKSFKHLKYEDELYEALVIDIMRVPKKGGPGNEDSFFETVMIKILKIDKTKLGNKFSSRYSQKGVIGDLLIDKTMPAFADLGVKNNSLIPDVLFNGMGIPTRMTMGMMLEGQVAMNYILPNKLRSIKNIVRTIYNMIKVLTSYIEKRIREFTKISIENKNSIFEVDEKLKDYKLITTKLSNETIEPIIDDDIRNTFNNIKSIMDEEHPNNNIWVFSQNIENISLDDLKKIQKLHISVIEITKFHITNKGDKVIFSDLTTNEQKDIISNRGNDIVPIAYINNKSLRNVYYKLNKQILNDTDATSFNSINANNIIRITSSLGWPPSLKFKATTYIGNKKITVEHPIFVCCIFYSALKHLVWDKIQARAAGPLNPETKQPPKGKGKSKLGYGIGGGGIRTSELKVWCIEAHGAKYILNEHLKKLSDPFDAYIDRKTGLFTCREAGTNTFRSFRDDRTVEAGKINIPWSLMALNHQLAACGIKMTFNTRYKNISRKKPLDIQKLLSIINKVTDEDEDETMIFE